MNAEIQTVSPTRSVLVLSATTDEAGKVRAEIVREYASRASIPGFRPGKAPAALVERKFADRIAADAAARLESRTYENAVKENDLDVAEIVSVDDRKTAEDGSVSFRVTVDLSPKFDLPPLEGIPVDDKDTAVTDEQVDARIESFRRAVADFADMPEGAAAAKDDMLEIDYSGKTADGKPLAEAFQGVEAFAAKTGAWLTVDSDYFMVPGIPKAMAGRKVGDTVEVPVEFPKDFFKDELKGVAATYTVTVKAGRRLALPDAADPAFLKRAGVADADELRKRVRESLEAEGKRADRVRRVNQIAKWLASSVSFELPQGALERETENALSELLRFNMDKGVAKEDLSKERERLQSAAREQAAERLRTDFVLDAARAKLGVTLSQEEFSGWVNQMVRARGYSADQIKELGKNREQLRRFYAVALREKVLAGLLKTAKPTAGVQ